MLEQPKPAQSDNEQILATLKEQTIWLQKLNEKFALLLIFIVIGAVINLLF